MKAYEYEVRNIGDQIDDLNQVLNEYGAEGWRVVSIIGTNENAIDYCGGNRVTFEREISGPEDRADIADTIRANVQDTFRAPEPA